MSVYLVDCIHNSNLQVNSVKGKLARKHSVEWIINSSRPTKGEASSCLNRLRILAESTTAPSPRSHFIVYHNSPAPTGHHRHQQHSYRHSPIQNNLLLGKSSLTSKDQRGRPSTMIIDMGTLQQAITRRNIFTSVSYILTLLLNNTEHLLILSLCSLKILSIRIIGSRCLLG